MHKNGLSIGLLNYVTADTNPNIPPGAGVFLNMFNEEKVLREVSDLSKKTDVVLLHLHLGKVELIRYPSAKQINFAHRAVEAGATVVVCCHAHCLQGHEDWKAGHIFYGLGNFVFGDIDELAWPKLSLRTAVAGATISRNHRERILLKYLYQRGLRIE